jgi:hypothetical protein
MGTYKKAVQRVDFQTNRKAANECYKKIQAITTNGSEKNWKEAMDKLAKIKSRVASSRSLAKDKAQLLAVLKNKEYNLYHCHLGHVRIRIELSRNPETLAELKKKEEKLRSFIYKAEQTAK